MKNLLKKVLLKLKDQAWRSKKDQQKKIQAEIFLSAPGSDGTLIHNSEEKDNELIDESEQREIYLDPKHKISCCHMPKLFGYDDDFPIKK
jgi:hypothetical protein